MIYGAFFSLLILARVITSPVADYRFRRPFTYHLFVIATFVLIAFRYRVGCDFGGYESHFQSLRLDTFEDVFRQGGEPLYYTLMYVLINSGANVFALNVVAAGIYVLGLNAIGRRQPDPLLFLALTFPILTINIGMSAVRQAISLGILCFAFNAFTDRRPVRFIALVLLATGFHTSSLLMLGFAPFALPGVTGWRAVVSAFALFSVGVFASGSETVSFYTDRYVNTSVNAAGAVFRTMIYPVTGIYFLILRPKDWRRRFYQDYVLLLLSSIIMIALPFITIYSSVIGDRISYYFAVPQYIIAARAYLFYRGTMRQVAIAIPLILLFSIMIGWIALSPLYADCYGTYRMWLG